MRKGVGKVIPSMSRVFLSHPHAEGRFAVKFARWLEKIFENHIAVICTSEPKYHIDSGHMLTSGIVEQMRTASVVLVLITNESRPWIFYEMGVAHVLGKVFIPCVARGLLLPDLPVQAHEYQGVDLSSAEDLRNLVRALSHSLKIVPVVVEDYRAVAQTFASFP